MFITARNPAAGRPITAKVYDQDGNPLSIEFVAQYRRFKRRDYQVLREQLMRIGQPVLDDAGQATGAVHQPPYETDTAFLRDVMIGWVGVDREFSPDELESLLEDWPELVAPLAAAFHDVHATIPTAREKN